MTRPLALLALGLFAVLAAVGVSAAAAEPRILDDSIELDYPRQLHFRVSAQSDAEITEIALRYTIQSTGIRSLTRPDSFVQGASVSATVTLDVNTGGGYIPMGTVIEYFWEVTDASGATFTSEPMEYLLLPPDADWQVRENEALRIYYQAAEEGFVDDFLDAALDTNGQMGALLGSPLQNAPVLAVFFPNRSEMDIATSGSELEGNACGVRVSRSNIYLSPEPCGRAEHTDILRHEFTHILIGENAGDAIPLWINEGTAVSAEVDGATAYAQPFEAALASNRLFTFLEMQREANPTTRVGLFYGQSFAMVQFLLKTGGEAKYTEFFAAMEDGERYDRALETVYGFDLAGFEAAFRESYGLPADAATPAPSATSRPPATTGPTRVVAGEDGGGDGGGISPLAIGIIFGAVILGLLGVLMYLWVLLRAKGGSAPPPAPPAGPASGSTPSG